jgi:hypothetical protein
LGVVVMVAVLIIATWTVIKACEAMGDRRIRNDRRKDVRILTQTYLGIYGRKICSDVRIEDLIAAAKQRGMQLKNPLAIDPSRPCYQLASPESVLTSSGRSDVVISALIEESDNVDSSFVVRSYIDGRITLVAKPHGAHAHTQHTTLDDH